MSSPSFRIFTIIYLKQTMFLGCLVLQEFCIYICAISNVMSHVKYICTFISVLSQVCVQCSMWLFCVVNVRRNVLHLIATVSFNISYLQKKPLYMLPSLGCGPILIIFSLMLSTAGCIRIVTDLKEYDLFYVAIFVLSVGKEVGCIL